MRIAVKFFMLFCGCGLLGSAFVPLVMWAVCAALVNYGSEVPENLPTIHELVMRHLVYSLEMAVGLLLIKRGLTK